MVEWSSTSTTEAWESGQDGLGFGREARGHPLQTTGAPVFLRNVMVFFLVFLVVVVLFLDDLSKIELPIRKRVVLLTDMEAIRRRHERIGAS